MLAHRLAFRGGSNSRRVAAPVWRRAFRTCLTALLLPPLLASCIWGLAWFAREQAASPLREESCGPLQVVDRRGRLLRSIPSAFGHRGRAPWVAISEMPQVLLQAVVASEDKRFNSHPGVDLLAAARAALQNLLAGRTVSGASTITMQLMRLAHHPRAERDLSSKLREMWLALAAEHALSKEGILEAYLNHAYYGRGAHGIEEAARLYFDKSARALSDGEAVLLAVLPRAPAAYDPIEHPGRALARRDRVLRAMVSQGRLSEELQRAVARERPRPSLHQPERVFEAPHFVDWVLSLLPDERRRAGGVLTTTLDLDLQHRLQQAVQRHLRRLAPRGIEQAGVVVLDSAGSRVRAMVGSASYDSSQINIVTRRRHPGSLLKPFVYALAVEAGAHGSSLALDIGDIPSEYRSRDWVGREHGPVRYREALAGSLNLAAVHVLERVGVAELHARLRQAGVAEAPSPPGAYGLQMALGATRVRLLDATAGFGFLVRGGLVRRPVAIESLRLQGLAPADWHPSDPGEERIFSPQVAWITMDMLGDPAARHRRFGRGLPVEGTGRVAAKTGTASGLSDVSTVLASRQYLVGAWAGRFDGSPAAGVSGMWAAAPLARLALDTALGGEAPALPSRPEGVALVRSCPLSGLPAGPSCPGPMQGYALAGAAREPACHWHPSAGATGQEMAELRVPEQLAGWAARARSSGQDALQGHR